MVPLTDPDERGDEGEGGEPIMEVSPENESEEERDVGELAAEVESEGKEMLLYTGEQASDGNDISEQAVQNAAAKAGTREKLQVRGRGKGSKSLREGITSENDTLIIEVRGRGRGRRGRGRGRGNKGRGGMGGGRGGGDGGEFVSTDSPTGNDSASSDSDDGILADVLRQAKGTDYPGRGHQARVNGRGRAQSREAETKSTFEHSKELSQWLSEITFISSWHSDPYFAGTTSPGLRLKFDGSNESGPSVTLPVFKSATISSSAEVQEGVRQPCSDIVLHVGGPIWALDWCPRRPGWAYSGNEKSEFLAVGAHPTTVPYNRLGKPLRGQGLLQIWAFDFSTIDQHNGDTGEVEGSVKQSSGSGNGLKSGGKRPRSSSREKSPGSGSGRSRCSRAARTDILANFQGDLLLLEDTVTGHGVLSTSNGEDAGDAFVVLRESGPATQSCLASSSSGKRQKKLKESARARCSDTSFIETRYPRWHKEEGPAKMVLGLVHEGLVTWDAKWRPVGEAKTSGLERELFRLGFLALLLGDGSIQVFDIPLPSMLPAESSQGPVFPKAPQTVGIRPIFRCSDLHSGGHKSIPLSLEWSTWDPHDLILVGFHDATVGLWKFSTNPQQSEVAAMGGTRNLSHRLGDFSYIAGWMKHSFSALSGLGVYAAPQIRHYVDTAEARPLMFFTADSLPLRSVAWAPDASGSAGKHIFVTAGHTGWVKFWDIRDPFRPFWDLQVSRGCIHSIDWIPWPRCLLMTLDDGTLRILGLDNASSRMPATGELWHGTHSQGIQCYLCSSFPIWDAQVSRSTGIVAYAGANGSVLQFQLTERAVVKEKARAREPHFLCGAFFADSEFGPVTLTSPQKTAPAQMRKSSTEWSSRPRTMRGFLATCTLDSENRQASSGLELALTTEISPTNRVRKKHSKAIGKIRRKDDSQSLSFPKAELELLPSADDGMALVPIETPGYGIKAEQNLPLTTNFTARNTAAPADDFPCQKVSVHRLRWNCNPTREHWLAYGGAAGIVRCQQVFSMKKRQKGDI